jgi:hypothetical protein
MVWVDNMNSVDEVIDFLVHQTPDRTTDASCYDALLVNEFFPQLGQDFHVCSDFTEEQVENFKNTFCYERFGLDRETSRKRIAKFRSIERVLDTLVMLMPVDIKQQLMKEYLLEIWFKQNSDGNLDHFKSNLNRKYWITDK